ncbi:unnamed protein product, partial [Brassica oleracea]
MLKREIVESLLGPLGEVGPVELHAKKLKLFGICARKVTIPTELEYEKLIKVCYTCKRLTHDQSRCPLQVSTLEDPSRGTWERSKEENLRRKLLEKEVKAKEALQRGPGKGVQIGNTLQRESTRAGRARDSGPGKEDKRKGKRVASSPRVMWKQKADRG